MLTEGRLSTRGSESAAMLWERSPRRWWGSTGGLSKRASRGGQPADMEGQTAIRACRVHAPPKAPTAGGREGTPAPARCVVSPDTRLGDWNPQPCVPGQEGSWEAGLSQQLNKRGWLSETNRKRRSEMPSAAVGSVFVLRTRAAVAPQVASDGSLASLASRWADVPASTARFTCQIRCPRVPHAHLSL